MSSLRKSALGKSIRLGDPDFANEVACQNEKKDWIARKFDLPGIGSKLVSQHGIQWAVQNHAEAPTIDTLQRWRNQQIDPKTDLYPAISPLNFSPRLMEFFHAVDRCTTKKFAILDTMPGRRNDGRVPGGNSIDTVCHPTTNLLFLDAARVHETVIAHEFGHAWVQYVDECEDFRTMEDASDPQRMRQVSYVQSFVLDLKVNDLLRHMGFDMEPIEGDQARSILQLATSLDSGYRPEHPREEVFMALLVADQIVQHETGRSNELVRIDDCLQKIRGTDAPLARLAETMATSVSRNGYETHDSIIRCVDECLLASFEHIGERFDLDCELTLVDPDEPNLDKFPIWLTQLPPKLKCKVGQHMALNEISSAWPHHLEQSLTGRARVIFDSPQRDRRSQVLVDHRIGPPTPYFGISENEAEVLELKRTNEERMDASFGKPATMPEQLRAAMEMARNIRKTGTELQGEMLQALVPKPPGRPYMAGLGSFLTAARLAEQLQGEQSYSYALCNPVTYVDPDGEKPQKHDKKCPPGWKLVSVTCYGIADPAHPKSNADAAYGSNPNCGGCNRKGRTGDCANDTVHGHKTVCGAGQTVTIAYPGNPPKIKTKCTVCDTGQGHNGIDVYVDVPDSDCGKYFNQTTYCVKCS